MKIKVLLVSLCIIYFSPNRRISGLDAGRAKKIIDHRDKNGPFINREQLLQVKGIGPKTYEQCIGFVRISTQSSAVASTSHDDDVVELEYQETLTKTGKKRKAPSSRSKLAKKSKTDVKPNPLDMTCIHPESYHIAEQ